MELIETLKVPKIEPGTPGDFQLEAWPIVHIRWPPVMHEEDFPAFEKGLDALLETGERFSIVMDISGVKPPTAEIRRLISQFQKTRFERNIGQVQCFAFVVESRVMRGALTAIRWLVPAAYDEGHFETRAQAVAWIRKSGNDATKRQSSAA